MEHLSVTKWAFAPEDRFHSSYNYWQKYLLFGVFAQQELGMILIIGTPFLCVFVVLALTSE